MCEDPCLTGEDAMICSIVTCLCVCEGVCVCVYVSNTFGDVFGISYSCEIVLRPR